MRWTDVVGHADAVARLRRGVARDRPAGAYLLVGPAGVGKRLVADTFATHLLCDGPDAEGSCGLCPQCVRVAAGTHPDVLVVRRDEDRRDVRIDQVRELTKWLALHPLMARRKVAILDGADDLNEHGQNALLKTLEEPPPTTVLVLLARASTLLLPTVRSRCQLVRLDPLTAADVLRVLEGRGVTGAPARTAAARAQGSPGRALRLAASGEADDPVRARVLDLLARLPDVDAVEVSQVAQEIARGPIDDGLDVLVTWYRDVVEQAAGSDRPPRNADAGDRLADVAGRLLLPTALRILERVCATVSAIEHNANRALAVEVLLLDARDLERRSVV